MVSLHLQTLYEDNFCQIDFAKEEALLQLTFRVQPDLERFRNVYYLAFDTARRRQVRFWLTDARQIKTMPSENQAWLKQEMAFFFQFDALRKFAIVMAPECFVMTNPNQVYNAPSSAAEVPTGAIKVHFDKAEAINWLLQPE